MELLKCIEERRSYRAYKDEELKEEELDSILECGMKAPVARGIYENLKLVVLRGEKLKVLRELLLKNLNSDPTYNCPCLVLIYHKGENNDLANLDAGCVGENMMLRARDLGIDSVMIYCIKRFFEGYEDLKPYSSEGEFKFLVSIALGKTSDGKVRDIDHKIEVIK